MKYKLTKFIHEGENMFNLPKVLQQISQALTGKSNVLEKEEIAKILKTSPEALEVFEREYWNAQKDKDANAKDFFSKNSRMVSKANRCFKEGLTEQAIIVAEAIVEELLNEEGFKKSDMYKSVSKEVLMSLPKNLRPQLTGRMMVKEIQNPSHPAILSYYKMYLEAKTDEDRINYYLLFLQGLDLLDLDLITYEILGCNQNSIGHWFPQLKEAVDNQEFFKVPETKIVKVPLPILQLTRLEYQSLTPTTLKIVNDFCMEVFDLDVNKEYFIKTGTYSSKFDFRNAVVKGESEVKELGEYLLYIHHQANQMAGMLNNVSIPGVSTTNEWVVREYIPDKENNPCIYKGMPLHTEYRFFIDFDTKEILGVSPYWRSDVMKKSFSKERVGYNPDKAHDYVIYTMHEEVLYDRYNKNLEKVSDEINKLIKNVNLSGQWSLDVMQNGDDFWLIDMALANESALRDVVPKEKLKQQRIDWIPKIPETK